MVTLAFVAVVDCDGAVVAVAGMLRDEFAHAAVSGGVVSSCHASGFESPAAVGWVVGQWYEAYGVFSEEVPHDKHNWRIVGGVDGGRDAFWQGVDDALRAMDCADELKAGVGRADTAVGAVRL